MTTSVDAGGPGAGLPDPGAARAHWREALDRYTVLGVPEAAEVRAVLEAG